MVQHLIQSLLYNPSMKDENKMLVLKIVKHHKLGHSVLVFLVLQILIYQYMVFG